MTEEDTFRVLARPSLEEMRDIHAAWWSNLPNKDSSLRISFMKSYGWTWLEFMRERHSRSLELNIS
jgi:hypothetical protein